MLIYIACDETKFRQQLESLLASQNYTVERLVFSGKARERLLERPPQLIVVSGDTQAATLMLLQTLRAEERLRPIPVLCVNPRGGASEGIAFLEAGADDFINRPFNEQIFVARTRTLLRRRVWTGQIREEVTILESGPLQLRLVSRQATLMGRALELTRLEFELLAFMLREPDRVFLRREILQGVWNYPEDVETRTVEKHVEMLRKKLGSEGDRIETIHGIGYRFAGPGGRSKPR